MIFVIDKNSFIALAELLPKVCTEAKFAFLFKYIKLICARDLCKVI